MVRTQIQLTDEQARRLRRRAKQLGISASAVIRQCLDESLEHGPFDRAGHYEPAARLVGRFADRSRATDLAAGHDRHLDEAFR
jgi:predicted transcriptional regulator